MKVSANQVAWLVGWSRSNVMPLRWPAARLLNDAAHPAHVTTLKLTPHLLTSRPTHAFGAPRYWWGVRRVAGGVSTPCCMKLTLGMDDLAASVV
jgi:hypothetical protein